MWYGIGVLVVGFILITGIEYVVIQKRDVTIGGLNLEVTRLVDAAKLEAKDRARVDEENRSNAEVVKSQLASALAAHELTSNALAQRVQDYLKLERNAGAAGKSGSAGQPPRSDNTRESSDTLGSVVDTITALVPACQAVVDQDRACQDWAKGVSCDVRTVPAVNPTGVLPRPSTASIPPP